MIRRLSIKLLERLYDRTQQKNSIIHDKIEEYRKRAAELGQEPDENVINKYLKQPGLNVWLSEDCGGYKRGRKLDDKDIQNIKQQGYETVWVSDLPVKDYDEINTKKAEALSLRNKIIETLNDIFIPIDEKSISSTKRSSKIDLLDGRDLLSARITPLQREGAAIAANEVLGDIGSKIEPLKNYIDKLYSLGVSNITLNDNRTLGNLHLMNKNEEGKRRKRISDYLIKHSANVGIYFLITAHNIQKDRIESGAQSSTARYTAGQKFKQEFRVTYSQDVVKSSCLGAFIFDIGFNHKALTKIMDREIKELINESGEVVHKGFSMVNEQEYFTLKKHVNVGAHLIQNLGIDATSIITNMIRTHHAYLNGEGYPKRKGSDYDIVITRKDGTKDKVRVHRYNIAVHELTNLLSIIDTYDAMINRRPWRLPFTRYDAVEYIIQSSAYNYNPETGSLDERGVFSFAGHERREKKFDRYLVDMFLKSFNPYAIGEILPLRDVKTNKKLTEAVVVKHSGVPHRPVVRLKLKDKVVDFDLSEEKNHKYYLGEYIVTTRMDKGDEKEKQMQNTNYNEE